MSSRYTCRCGQHLFRLYVDQGTMRTECPSCKASMLLAYSEDDMK